MLLYNTNRSLTVTEYMSIMICSIYRKHNPVLSSCMTYHMIFTRVTQRVPLAWNELLVLLKHLIFNRICIAKILVFCLVFCTQLFVLLSFSFGHCIVCSSHYHFLVFPTSMHNIFNLRDTEVVLIISLVT